MLHVAARRSHENRQLALGGGATAAYSRGSALTAGVGALAGDTETVHGALRGFGAPRPAVGRPSRAGLPRTRPRPPLSASRRSARTVRRASSATRRDRRARVARTCFKPGSGSGTSPPRAAECGRRGFRKRRGCMRACVWWCHWKPRLRREGSKVKSWQHPEVFPGGPPPQY